MGIFSQTKEDKFATSESSFNQKKTFSMPITLLKRRGERGSPADNSNAYHDTQDLWLPCEVGLMWGNGVVPSSDTVSPCA